VTSDRALRRPWHASSPGQVSHRIRSDQRSHCPGSRWLPGWAAGPVNGSGPWRTGAVTGRDHGQDNGWGLPTAEGEVEPRPSVHGRERASPLG
jgi:hypothetical protein